MESINQTTPEPHPSVKAILRFFRFEHLPEEQQELSAKFAELAAEIALLNVRDPETTTAIRKLLEAKDAAVRASLNIPV